MNILVCDVAASEGGALTVLKEYYDKACLDKNNNWYFLLSDDYITPYGHIHLIKFKWIKKSWFHRLFFDLFIADKVVKKYKVDKIVSLQNIILKTNNRNQVLYFHNLLPFAKKKYKLFENPRFWAYQTLIKKLILNSLKLAKKIIVQTEFVKSVIISEGIETNKIVVEKPTLNRSLLNETRLKGHVFYHYRFIYPAAPLEYKNYLCILQAAELLNKSKIPYEIIFTFKANENKYAKFLKRYVDQHDLNVIFMGYIPQKSLFQYYQESTLLYTSEIESFGFPLLEARELDSNIIAIDLPYAKELLKNYEKVEYFQICKADDLYDKMLCRIIGNRN